MFVNEWSISEPLAIDNKYKVYGYGKSNPFTTQFRVSVFIDLI